MSNPLTMGAIREIFTNPDDLPKNPVLQVLGLKKITSGQGNSERYRLVLSDGLHLHTCAMLATQLNDLVANGEIEPKAIVRLDKFICNTIQDKRKVLIIIALTVIQPGSQVATRFGDPQTYNDQQAAAPSKTVTNQSSRSNMQQSSGHAGNQSTFNGPSFRGNQPVPRNANTPTVFPISSLSPYQNRWTICARVTSKSSIRNWSNSRGEGRLFSVDLVDESGEIRATCFTDYVDKFYDLLQSNKVYYISRGSVKPANKRYSSLKNDYEMQFNAETVIEPCTNDVPNLPTLQFNFNKISNIESVEKDNLVDLIGVCVNISDLSEVSIKSTGRQVQKREISLLDSTASVSCTLWGSDAENFEKHVGTSPIIAIKGARVSDFGGRSLSLISSSVMQVDPDNLQEAFRLRGWYDSVGRSENISSISGQKSEGLGSTNYKTIADIQNENLGMGEKPDYFTLLAVIGYFRKENCLYKACPKTDCNKKVMEDGTQFRCEKCNQSYQDYKHRIILGLNVSDFTGEQWLTCFQDSGEKLLSITADELGNLKEQDEKAFEQVFTERTFKTWLFRIRAKVEKFNDESRLKCTAVSISTVDFKKESCRLLEEIEKLL